MRARDLVNLRAAYHDYFRQVVAAIPESRAILFVRYGPRHNEHLSLIVNELVSNSLEHAFPGGRSGHIWVSLERTDDERLVLAVQDDGIGIARTGLDRSQTLGLQIVSTLARQLHGTLETSAHGGTTTRITFAHHAAVGVADPSSSASSRRDRPSYENSFPDRR